MYIDGVFIKENWPISCMTTMRLGGKARYVATLEKIEDIKPAYEFAKKHSLPIWVMGEGANTIGRDEGFEGIIFLNNIRDGRIRVKTDDGRVFDDSTVTKSELTHQPSDEILLTGEGGLEWDYFVYQACELGYSGIEAMSMIPGSLGAAPVQNIGAYGQDIAKVIESIEAFDLREGKLVTIDKSEMGMDYRHTRFNAGEDVGRFMITSVTVRLKKGELKPPFYNSLQKYIEEHNETDFSPMNIRKMVMKIREDKLPDPKYEASAGSFFKNVYVDRMGADEAERKGIPVWRDVDGGGKINSGWLIEACGLKGKKMFGFKVSDKAALILINESAKSYADLAKARAEIVDTVQKKFGYALEQEPVELVLSDKLYHGANK